MVLTVYVVLIQYFVLNSKNNENYRVKKIAGKRVN